MEQQHQPTKRSRVSCFPCRSRKSKCDQNRPCSSCVLRDTVRQCTELAPESSPNKPVKSKRKRVEHPSPTDNISPPIPKPLEQNPFRTVEQEFAHLREGLCRLEGLLVTQSVPKEDSEDEDDHDDGRSYGPSSPASRQRWSQLRSLLPPIVDTHLMFHYAFVESDWLLEFFDYRRFIRRWEAAYLNRAISDMLAVQVLALTACSALFLADNSNRVLQSAIPIRSIHHRLMKQAVGILEAVPRTAPTEGTRMDLIECHIFVSLYFRCLGPDAKMARFVERALAIIIDFGLDDELHPSWLGLTQFQIERRRILVNTTCFSARWLGFHARFVPVLDTIRNFRVGQASYRNFGEVPPLDEWPCSDALTDGHRSMTTAWKTKTPEQIHCVKQYVKLAGAQSYILPTVSHLIVQIETRLINEQNTGLITKQEFIQLVKETKECLDTLSDWRKTILPNASFGENQIAEAHRTLLFQKDAKRVALMLLLNHAIYYMTTALLRPWILLSDRARRIEEQSQNQDYHPPEIRDGFLTLLNQQSIERVQLTQFKWMPDTFWGFMESKSIEIAQQSISTIALIRVMQADPKSQFYVGWVAASLYEAALTLAVPLLRYHRRQSLYPNVVSNSQTTFPTDFGNDIVAVLEALAQLSNNAMAKGTGELLQKVMQAAKVTDRTGVQLPRPSPSTDHADTDDWEFSNALPRVKKGATDGLALLAEASAPTDQYGRISESSSSSSKHTAPSSVEANPADIYQALLTSQTETKAADAHFLEDLLKLDDSFWESVMNSRLSSSL